MKILYILVYVTGELKEFLHCLGRSFFRSLIALGLTAALNTKELVNGIGFDGAFRCICLGLRLNVEIVLKGSKILVSYL